MIVYFQWRKFNKKEMLSVSLQLFLIMLTYNCRSCRRVQDRPRKRQISNPDEHLNCWHTKQNHKMAADNKYEMRLSNTSTITTSEKGQKGNKDIWMLTWGQKSLFLVCIQSHIQNLLPLLSSVCGKHFLNMTCVEGCCTKLLHNMTLIYQQSTGTCGVLVLFPAGGGNV